MKKEDFLKKSVARLENDGYKKIKIYPKIFSKKADIYCKDKKGRKRHFLVELKKNKIVLKDMDSLDWIDELEMIDALFD